MTALRRSLLCAFVVLFGCPGPGGAEPDGGSDDGAIVPDVGTDAGTDTGLSCQGEQEGAYICGGLTQQCCGGTWRTYADGPCLRNDAGPVPRDAGPPDCSGSAEREGCPCASGAADVCVVFSDSLRCESGVWTRLVDISCCVGP